MNARGRYLEGLPQRNRISKSVNRLVLHNIIGASLLLGAPGARAARFGQADSTFNAPRFTARCYPSMCFADGRSGLLWNDIVQQSTDLIGANGLRVGGLVRTTNDGVVDTNFVVGPELQEAAGAAIQVDGKVLVGGRMAGDLATNGAPNYHIFRFLTNGVLDISYQSPVFGYAPRFMTLQPDGKLLTACTSNTHTAPNNGIIDLVRLNTDGSLDAGFQRPVETGLIYGVYAPPVVDTNGAIYMTGGFSQINGQPRPSIARLNSDGSLDTTFAPYGFTSTAPMRGILVQADGRVVIAGKLKLSSAPSTAYGPLMRLNNDGSVDPSFNIITLSSINFYRAMYVQATTDGKFLVIGASMVRLNSDGSLDNTFTRLPFGDASGNTNVGTACYWFAQLADGRIVIPSGSTLNGDAFTINGQPFNGSVRLLADGTLDSTFSSPTFQQEVFPTLVTAQGDGRLLVAGAFDHAGTAPQAMIARLATTGVVDSTYTPSFTNVVSVLGLAPSPANQAYALLKMPTQTPGAYVVTSNAFLRLQADGTVDSSFNVNPGVLNPDYYSLSDLLVVAGQPLLSGSPMAQAVYDQTNSAIVRLLSNGNADPTFTPDFMIPGTGYWSDGSLITNWSQVSVVYIGSISVGDIQLLTPTADGKLIIGVCTNTDYGGGLFSYRIARLNTDGTLDNTYAGVALGPAQAILDYPTVTDYQSFSAQVTTYEPVRCLSCAVVQSNGAVIVGGSFTNAGGLFRPGIVRLRPDSTLDTGFPVGAGPATAGNAIPVTISGLAQDSAGKVWVSGNFVQWDGVLAPGYVRLNVDGTVDTNSVSQTEHFALNDSGVSRFSGTLTQGPSACYIFGPHLLPGDIWPRAVTRLIAYAPPRLTPLGMQPGSGFRVTFQSNLGDSYWLQTTTDLQSWGNWLSVTGTGNQMIFIDSQALSSAQKFYRLIYQ